MPRCSRLCCGQAADLLLVLRSLEAGPGKAFSPAAAARDVARGRLRLAPHEAGCTAVAASNRLPLSNCWCCLPPRCSAEIPTAVAVPEPSSAEAAPLTIRSACCCRCGAAACSACRKWLRRAALPPLAVEGQGLLWRVRKQRIARHHCCFPIGGVQALAAWQSRNFSLLHHSCCYHKQTDLCLPASQAIREPWF